MPVISPESPEAIQASTLVKKLHASGDPVPLTEFFKETAGDLRDENQRIAASATSLPVALSDTLHITISHFEASQDREGWYDLLTEICRTAANFAADNDTNRGILVKMGYIKTIMTVLQYDRELPVATARALSASILNLAVDGHEPSIYALVSELVPLLDFADTQGASGRPQVAQWLWTVIDLVCETNLARKLLPPFQRYLKPRDEEYKILESASETYQALSMKEGIDRSELGKGVGTLLHFLEVAESAEGNEENEKMLGKVKATLINAIVELSATVDLAKEFWSRMKIWISGRDDLQSCGLLCFGNKAREDSSARALLQDLESNIIPLLRKETPVKTQHAVLGLLKNLTVPAANRVVLGKHNLPERFVEMGVWTSKRDLVGSVQGGAIGIIKNLCRDNRENSVQFITNDLAREAVLQVMYRTDDAPTKFEGTRIFVNVLRTCSSLSDCIAHCSDPRIIKAMCEMLKEGGPYPVLSNEALIALAILATFGDQSTKNTIREKIEEALPAMFLILAPSGTSKSVEVQANALTLCKALGEEEDFRKRFVQGIDAAKVEDVMPDALDLAKQWR